MNAASSRTTPDSISPTAEGSNSPGAVPAPAVASVRTSRLAIGYGRRCGGISDTLIDVDDLDDEEPFMETRESYIAGQLAQARK